MGKDKKFLQFPLRLLTKIWGDYYDKEKALDNIIQFGIVEFAYRLQKTETAKKIIRDYARKDPLFIKANAPDIYKKLNELEEKEPFLGGDEVAELPEDEFNELAKELAESFTAEELAFFAIPLAKSKNYLNIDGGDIFTQYETWKKNSTDGPMPMINKSLAFEFRDYKKSEFDVAQFTGFIACRSIIGTARYKKTNKNLVVARMLGYSNPKNLKVTYLNKRQRHIWDKYRKRYHFEKLMGYLEANWGLHYYSRQGIRGFYIANATKISLETLIKQVNKPNKIEEKQHKKKELKTKHERHFSSK